ncbi:MAG: alpha/beta fold hydrolase [Gemmatimonadota bacterium]|nr:alpha/beta fold hydrolase [Gemmatimonadota bacterium]
MRRRIGLIGLALAIATSTGTTAQTFPDLAADAPAGSGELEACTIEGVDGTARCGRFRVFEDRDARSGRTIDLAFVILDATGEGGAASDVLIPLPGGPGQGFTNAGPAFAQIARPMRRTRDVLLVDVRGVGRSRTLDCPDFEIELADRFGTVFPPDHIRMCRDALAEHARLDLYTTPLSVDDVDELRTWLGYDAVNLLGVSYGTRVGQVYMRRHPQAVRTAILNSVAPVFVLGYVEMARSLQRSLDLVVAECEETTECAAAHPGLRGKLDDVLARFERGPVNAVVDGETVAFTKGDFAYALRGLLYGQSEGVPDVIVSAFEGDFDEVASYYVQRSGWVGSVGGEAGYHFSALCPEDILPLTDGEVAEASEGTFMGDHLIAGYRETCRIWGARPADDDFWDPVESDVPTLVVSGEFDPVTPPAWGDAVAGYLPNSIHVVVPGGGHGPGNECTLGLMTRLIETGGIEDLDPSCMG